MATPIVTGAIALLLSMNPEFTPKDVKTRLRDRALDLGQAKEKQGWGMLNIKKLLE